MASNLFTFLAQRLVGSFSELHCGDVLGMRSPIRADTDRNGVAVDAKISVPAQKPAAAAAPPAGPTTHPHAGRATGTVAAPTTW
jgi:hypothetical protein